MDFLVSVVFLTTEKSECFNIFEVAKKAEAEGRLEDAVAFFDKAGECFLRNRELLFAFKSFLCCANIYEKIGDLKEVLLCLKKATLLGDELFAQGKMEFFEFGEALFVMASTLGKMHRKKEALKVLEYTINLDKREEKEGGKKPPWIEEAMVLLENLKKENVE